MQKVKSFVAPPSIEDFLDSHRMTVKTRGFSTTSLKLVSWYLESNEEPQTLDNLRSHASRAELTVVRVDDEVIFRKLMKPMTDVVEIQRADQGVICEICGYVYLHHPPDAHPNEFLKILCNGRRVKL